MTKLSLSDHPPARRGLRLLLPLALLLAAPPLAHAETDIEVYRKGKTQFDLGDFAKAIELFKKAYELADKPAYLYNIGFTYDKLGDCRNALHFYETFMKRATSDPAKPLKEETRVQVQGLIETNKNCVEKLPPLVTTEPDPDPDKDPDKLPVVGDTTRPPPGNEDECIDGDEEACGPPETPLDRPTLIVARLSGGAGIIGAGPLEVPPQLAVALTAGYPLPIGNRLTLELGAGLTFTPVPYEAGTMDGSASMTAVLANVGLTAAATSKIGVHLDVGVGVLMFGGLEADNPFTEGGAPTTGALSMLNLRFGLTGEYAVTPNVLVSLTPIAFSYSPAKEGLREDITSLTRLEFLAGVGFRR